MLETIHIRITSTGDAPGVLTSFGESICFLARNIVPYSESVEHSFLYFLMYFYHIIIILRLIISFFTLDCVTVSLFQLRHEELIFLLKIPFLLLESHLQYRVHRLFMIVLNMMERKKDQYKLKSSYTRQGNMLYKEKIYRFSIKIGLCVQHMEMFQFSHCGSPGSSSRFAHVE